VFFLSSDASLDSNVYKIAYWLSFVALPLVALWRLRGDAYLYQCSDGSKQPSIFGMIGTYGLLSFSCAALSGMFLAEAMAGDFVKFLRIVHLLACFLTLHLGLTRHRTILAWLLLAFTMSDAVRVVLAALVDRI
jgi:hypothetical protein